MKFFIPNSQITTNSWEYYSASIAVALQFLIGIAMIAVFWQRLPPVIPLWYSRPWGEDRLTSPWFLLLPLGFAVCIYFTNLLIASRLSTDHPMFTRVLFMTSLLISCLSIVLVIRIITLVS